MSLQEPVPLSDVRSELSCLLFAAKEAFDDFNWSIDFQITYNSYTYLQLEARVYGTVEEKKKRVRLVVDRLAQGILWGEYDYRFMGSSYSTHYTDDYQPHIVSATVNTGHWPHRRPHGWEPPVSPSERSSSSAEVRPRPPYQHSHGNAV